ncbi:Mog1p/PsbP-like protein [Coccomyxa subellipsoidea C-169]|uniref:Mog1p/PsbP-like protein n=1 Tax=Coccomyxa subellipsoidea (strain C-169) TaxID=574566 RepID=I0Z288_COCSC|nr:Mog1p/PsbP-like protein [Coccomyxa subellipsoidea C-169]EIE24757.1 Mog1p/PsbP-like protein [Coccomyxa subellipsoidea C-169]|eukprot:XP_005649301.1 Mog1p/PsbP-like protein [Coccomyxa subellipsoidea C-169]
MDQSAEPLQQVQLFGGAAEIAVPSRFEDVSNIRPVPDNQEVYSDASVDQSIVVEVVQVDVPDSDSCQHCFNDLANVSGASMQQIESETVLNPQDIPGVPGEAYKVVIVGQQMVSKGRQGTDAANRVIMAIIRLKQVSSDVLIILNTPISVSASSAAAKDIGPGERSEHLMAPSLLRRVLATFKIKDYSLFG